MTDQDLTQELQERVASAAGSALAIRGGASRIPADGDLPILDVSGHCGIIDYQPSELVLRARAGTPVQSLLEILRENGQMFASEPPVPTASSTLGGMVASGWSGPRRPFAGSVRDHVLGVGVLDGNAQCLNFGGQVMKNVAGYDVSRMQVGAWGCLGVLLDVSARLASIPELSVTQSFELDAEAAQARMLQIAREPWPVTALAFTDGLLHLRLEGTEQGVNDARQSVGGDSGDDEFWKSLNHQSLPQFDGQHKLWRLSVPASVKIENEDVVCDWGGSLRWVDGTITEADMKARIAATGGFARSWPDAIPLDTGSTASSELQRRLVKVFGATTAFNPHCLPRLGLTAGQQ